MPDDVVRQSRGCGSVLGIISVENMVKSDVMRSFRQFHLRTDITKVLDTGIRCKVAQTLRNYVLYHSLRDSSGFYRAVFEIYIDI